ncbi:MAG: hypothetical protein BWX87_01832 [Bacteroidetes bacterium ADurb.Bin123]|jgi:hypothetical protein|nr:MAG: hypothetical protein BWX87_01832 [Bacteroidetes bacterium ADurb.Bin123]
MSMRIVNFVTKFKTNKMKKLFFLLALTVALISCGSKEQKINTLTEAEIAEGWELLFNGVDMSNWKLYNGGEPTGWKVEDGIMKNSGVGSDFGGDIITRKQYRNFELYIEWQVASRSNSGIFFHVQEGVAQAIYQTGPEYQLIDDKGWPDPLEADQYSGANYGMHAPVGASVQPLDKWNETRLIVNGTHVEHWLNGAKVVEYELWDDDWNARKNAGKWKDVPTYGIAEIGHIGLQDHGGLTLFRNIKIREL